MPVDSGFPRRLFAVHIMSLAERQRSPVERERLGRTALAIHPSAHEEWINEADLDKNPGNWLSYDVLGHALCDLGRTDEGLSCFNEVVNRCPAAALKIGEIYDEAISAGNLPPAESDARSSFWSNLDRDALRAAVVQRMRRDA
jgi:hypothetical protein